MIATLSAMNSYWACRGQEPLAEATVRNRNRHSLAVLMPSSAMLTHQNNVGQKAGLLTLLHHLQTWVGRKHLPGNKQWCTQNKCNTEEYCTHNNRSHQNTTTYRIQCSFIKCTGSAWTLGTTSHTITTHCITIECQPPLINVETEKMEECLQPAHIMNKYNTS